jgi:Ni/Co efflux regulator RcnB
MKKSLVTLASSLLLVAAASAASPPQHHDRQDRGQRDYRGQQGPGRHDQRPGQVRYLRDSHGIHDDRGRYYVGHDRGRHVGWYKRGGRLPMRYRADRYYVTDWSAYRLRPPPRGYRWVRSDNSDFLLIAIATGIITDIVLSN